MSRLMKFELLDEAVDAIEKIAEFTNRTPLQVIIDALRTYEWILEEQTKWAKIVVLSEKPEEEEVELVDFVTDPDMAKDYFEAR